MFNTIAINDKDSTNCDTSCWQVSIVTFGVVVMRIYFTFTQGNLHEKQD